MHSKTDIIFFAQEKTLKAVFMAHGENSHVFFLLLLSASHSSWAPILLHTAIFKQIILKMEATILFVTGITV